LKSLLQKNYGDYNMNELGCLRVVYEIAKRYFRHTNIVWENQNSPKPPLPALILGFRDNTFHSSPCVFVDMRGVSVRERASCLKLRVAYLTGGEPLHDTDDGEYTAHYNASRVKLSGFLEFLDSPFVGNITKRHNITVLPRGLVSDSTNLLSGAAFDYRAECEVDVHYVSRAKADETGLEDSEDYINNINVEEPWDYQIS
jgi:hypothetical protein